MSVTWTCIVYSHPDQHPSLLGVSHTASYYPSNADITFVVQALLVGWRQHLLFQGKFYNKIHPLVGKVGILSRGSLESLRAHAA